MQLTRSTIQCARTLLLSCAFLPALSLAQSGGGFERPPVMDAAQLLPQNLLAGPNHTVQAAVGSDGFLNIYQIDSRWGPLRAVSNVQLEQYVGELDAVAKLSQLRGTKEFTAGMTTVAGDAVKGAGALITNPIGSVSGAVS